MTILNKQIMMSKCKSNQRIFANRYNTHHGRITAAAVLTVHQQLVFRAAVVASGVCGDTPVGTVVGDRHGTEMQGVIHHGHVRLAVGPVNGVEWNSILGPGHVLIRPGHFAAQGEVARLNGRRVLLLDRHVLNSL